MQIIRSLSAICIGYVGNIWANMCDTAGATFSIQSVVKSCIYPCGLIITPYRVHSVEPLPLVPSFYVTKSKMERTVFNIRCLDHVWKQQSPSCYSNNRGQRLRDQSSIAGPDAMLLVAFTHWRGQVEIGVTLMCHLDVDTIFMPAINVALFLQYVRAVVCRCVDLRLVLHK